MGFIHHWETRLLRSQVKFDHRRTAGEVRRCKKAAAAAGMFCMFFVLFLVLQPEKEARKVHVMNITS